MDEQQSILDEISAVLVTTSEPALFMGDYIPENSKRRVQDLETVGMHNFKLWVNSHAFIDLTLNDKSFTWSRGNSRSRINRVLCHSFWLVKFPSLILSSDRKSISDHTSLILTLEPTQNWSHKPFRSLNAWLKHPGFKELVQSEWIKNKGWAADNRLKLLKAPLR